MSRSIADLTDTLACNTEAVCRHYLPNGRREGRYWMIGDVHGTPGRSMYVRLENSSKGVAGKWTDHVALLDMLRPRVSSLIRRSFRPTAQHNFEPSRGIL